MIDEAAQEFQTLLQAIRAGDQEAARVFHDRYAHHIRKVVRRHLDSRFPKLRLLYDSIDFVQDPSPN